jgi:hypothetical protein
MMADSIITGTGIMVTDQERSFMQDTIINTGIIIRITAT